MIPKTIHYCWFGGKPLPKETLKYIESWRKYLPDYQIKEWNESNFDVHCCKYVEEAYNARKWAFVSDYARFLALFKEGGIYFDTDIEVIKSFDDLTNCNAFFGFSSPTSLTLPVFGADKKQNCFKDILEYYHTRNFIKEDGTFDTTTIEITAKIILTEKYGLVMDGSYQELPEGIRVYPKEYLYSTDWQTGIIEKNSKLHIIHYAEGSWIDENTRKSIKRKRRLIRLFGKEMGTALNDTCTYLKDNGIKLTIKKIIFKLKHI